ncbi:hypothetical protein QC762_607200 [Podospora pseudocomata]|uniref:Uncharacterized protein n=1 Tax=Podospora pseudocomata TaxID=2093779 RepID=A0ABR0G881_9PEZI|nr:hypothetical protein QC762_607200 [Podospora pseudocomata]
MSTEERAPLLSTRQGLPVANSSLTVQDHPIFLRVCHSPWPWVSQSCLVYLRGLIFCYLTGLAGMLLRYKFHHEYPHNEGKSNWHIFFEFASVAYLFFWLYHLITFCWSFTHLFFPDVDEDDNSWESVLLCKMSPPLQTPKSRKRLYFSIFYTISHVFVFMNTLIYWCILVPKGYGHLPKGKEGEPVSDSTWKDFWGHGWFEPFCILNLYLVTSLIALFEIFVLNSIKRQVPVPAHVIATVFFLSAYLGWAAFGKWFTGLYPFFWMDPEIMKMTEYIASYVAGFLCLGPTVFAFMYGLIGMRENMTHKDDGDKKQPAHNRSLLDE